MAQLLAPQFRATPDVMFSADGYHPSATAYALAADALLLPLCDAMGEKAEPAAPEVPEPAGAPALGQNQTPLSVMSRLWRRPASEVPAPSS